MHIQVLLPFDDMAEGSAFKRAIGAVTPTARVPTGSVPGPLSEMDKKVAPFSS